jgi:hypothetical protein
MRGGEAPDVSGYDFSPGLLYSKMREIQKVGTQMAQDLKVRWGWLKGMYIYTILGAGGVGLGMILIPETMRSIFGWPSQDPMVFGVCGSVYLSFGLLSILGLRSPLKLVPVLLLQLCYKVVWMISVVLPLLAAGVFPMYGVLHVVIFATYIIGDLIAIPFSYVFAKGQLARR